MEIAFWNVNKNKDIDLLLKDLIQENSIDILILAEYDGNIENLCKIINTGNSKFRTLSNIGCDKIKGVINSKYHQEQLFAATRYSIIGIKTTCFKIILSMIHAEANPRADDDDRQATFITFNNDILACEERFNTNNTIITGDLNSNPFDKSIIGISSLHAIPYKEETKRSTRSKLGTEYKKFYNPMWRLLGAKTPPYGTYYYSSSNAINYYWHTFDQVILRPCLLPAFEDESLRIITQIKDVTLLKNNYVPNKDYSDHLPIIFRIQEEKIK